jgi:uncharacterized protein YecE (DUF72 family)
VALRGYYLGCPGWASKSWVGRLYPPGTPSTEFLARYAEVFNTVEGNTTFYALPTADTVLRWRDDVPASFRFCFKFPRTITHDKLLVDAGAEVVEFLDRIAPIGDRLGVLMLQLPPRFTDLERLRGFLASLPAEHRYAVELRHNVFFAGGPEEDALVELVRERSIDLVMMDARGLHSSASLDQANVRARKPDLPIVMRAIGTHPIVRCVPHEVFDASRHLVAPWVDKLAQWIAQGKQPYFFMHAPDDTFAPENAYAFHAMLRAHTDVGELPPWPGAPRQLTLL